MNLTTEQFVMIAAITFMVMGIGTFLIGVIFLIKRGPMGEVRSLAAQTAKLAQKGLAEDVSGLVGNASALIDPLNHMTGTASGIGAFLVILGLLMMVLAYWIATRSIFA